ncbi:MAG: hypothetical protein WCS09_02950 [Pseudomonadota bacterium]|jgi:hypothetical protein
MLRPDELRQLARDRDKRGREEPRRANRTPEGAENNRRAARERYQRMSPEDRANYNQRITDRRRQRNQEGRE